MKKVMWRSRKNTLRKIEIWFYPRGWETVPYLVWFVELRKIFKSESSPSGKSTGVNQCGLPWLKARRVVVHIVYLPFLF